MYFIHHLIHQAFLLINKNETLLSRFSMIHDEPQMFYLLYIIGYIMQSRDVVML